MTIQRQANQRGPSDNTPSPPLKRNNLRGLCGARGCVLRRIWMKRSQTSVQRRLLVEQEGLHLIPVPTLGHHFKVKVPDHARYDEAILHESQAATDAVSRAQAE